MKKLLLSKKICNKTLIEDEWDIVFLDDVVYILVEETEEIKKQGEVVEYGSIEDYPEDYEELKKEYQPIKVGGILTEDDGDNFKAFW